MVKRATTPYHGRMNNENTIPITKVLVTGMSGLIGGVAGRELSQRGYEYRAQPSGRSWIPETRASITDAADPSRFEGIDCVVHMAAYLGPADASQLSVNIEGGTTTSMKRRKTPASNASSSAVPAPRRCDTRLTSHFCP